MLIRNVYVHRITRSWLEGTRFGSGTADGATWNSSDGTNTNNWITPGGDFDTRRAATATVSANNTWYAFDITDLVTDWVTGNQLNYGVLLEEGSTATNMSFASSDNGNASLNPKLSLDYVCECGQTCSPPTAPIAHWLLDESSGLSAADAVGGHTGTLNGGTWTTGKITGGLFLDGTSTNYVSVANAADLSPASFTLAAWIKSTSLSGIDTVLNKGTSGTNRQYWLGTNGNQISFGWYNGALRTYTTTTANLQTNTWYHVASSYDASSKAVKVYLNGTLLLTQTATVGPITNAEGISLGRSPSGEYWQGVLDDVWIQQGALSAAQIAALAGTPGPGTPVTVTLSATADSYVQQNSKNTNYGTSTSLILVGDQNKSKESIGYLLFQGINTIPAGATIQSATLRLYHYQMSGAAVAVNAYKISSAWTETGVTWSNQPSVIWTILSSTTANDSIGWKTWDVTPLVQEWVDAISANNGIALDEPNVVGTYLPAFYSRENGTLTPQLVVTYQ